MNTGAIFDAATAGISPDRAHHREAMLWQKINYSNNYEAHTERPVATCCSEVSRSAGKPTAAGCVSRRMLRSAGPARLWPVLSPAPPALLLIRTEVGGWPEADKG